MVRPVHGRLRRMDYCSMLQISYVMAWACLPWADLSQGILDLPTYVFVHMEGDGGGGLSRK